MLLKPKRSLRKLKLYRTRNISGQLRWICRYRCSIVNTSDLVCSTVRNVCSKMMSHIFAGDGEWLTAHFVPNTVFSSEIGAGGAGSQ